jgi:hypothetical protein
MLALANLAGLWNAALASAGIASAAYNLTWCGGHSQQQADQVRDWLYSSSLVNLVATLVLVVAFNATHWSFGDAPPRLAYHLPFITLGLFYLYRVATALYYSVPLLSLCLSDGVRSFGTSILFMQCVTYALIPVAACVYATSVGFAYSAREFARPNVVLHAVSHE